MRQQLFEDALKKIETLADSGAAHNSTPTRDRAAMLKALLVIRKTAKEALSRD